MCVELKVKIKSLAAETRIIRAEERKSLGRGRAMDAAYYPDDKKKCYATYEKLRHHRIEVVRREARATHLAYAFIRGKSNPEGAWDLKDHSEYMNRAAAKQSVYRMVIKYHKEYTHLYWMFKERNSFKPPAQDSVNYTHYMNRWKKNKDTLDEFYKVIDNWLSS